jgi:hypothetical protein
VSKAQNGSPQPSPDQLAAIAELAQALGAGSTKLCEALGLVFGEHDIRFLSASRVDRILQPLVTSLQV